MPYRIMSAFLLLVLTTIPVRAATIQDTFDLSEEQQWLQELSRQIRPGLRRADVEKLLLHRTPGTQPANATRYTQDGSTIIEVPYDQTGGPWTADNRVSGPVKIEHADVQ